MQVNHDPYGDGWMEISSSTDHFVLCVMLCHAVQVNGDPYGDGWMIKVKLADKGELDSLLSAEAYEKKCEH